MNSGLDHESDDESELDHESDDESDSESDENDYEMDKMLKYAPEYDLQLTDTKTIKRAEQVCIYLCCCSFLILIRFL